jgi:hypothetical protein
VKALLRFAFALPPAERETLLALITLLDARLAEEESARSSRRMTDDRVSAVHRVVAEADR